MSAVDKQEAALLAKALESESWTEATFNEYYKRAENEAITCSPHDASFDRRELLAKLRLVKLFIVFNNSISGNKYLVSSYKRLVNL